MLIVVTAAGGAETISVSILSFRKLDSLDNFSCSCTWLAISFDWSCVILSMFSFRLSFRMTLSEASFRAFCTAVGDALDRRDPLPGLLIR